MVFFANKLCSITLWSATIKEPYYNGKKTSLYESLKYYFGFDTFKGDQEKIIRTLMEGKNTFVLMPTGGGKSLCYQLPAFLMDGTAIVISPLIALMKNQVDAIKYISEEDNIAHFINSSLSRANIEQVKTDILAGKTKLLYVAPESLTDAVEFKSSFNRPNLYYEVRSKTKDINKDIIKYIKQHPGKSGIIYCMSRKKVEELADILKANDYNRIRYGY